MDPAEHEPTAHEATAHETRRPAPLRWLLVSAGVLCTVLAVVGALLPLIPTTPFLLLAGACFARSSPRLQRKLLENRLFGAYLREWQRDRTIPNQAKVKAYVLVVATFGVSIALVEETWQRGLLAGLGLALLVFLARLPTSRRGT
jgi:uncharacterized membrane protein YbaN (DUF454 family)